MSLREAQGRLHPVQTCKFYSFWHTLDEDDQAVIQEWVASEKPAGWIARIIRADGKILNEKTLKRHLDGVCLCPVDTILRGAYRGTA